MPSRTISRAPARSFERMHAVAILRQAADDEHEARRAEGERLVDRAPVVVVRRAPALAIDGGKHAAAAIAGDREPAVADAQRATP